MATDEFTTLIRSMYEQYPFPNCEYQRTQGMQLGMYFAREATNTRSLLAQGVRVLDAGCGTGSTVTPLALAYPESQFVGVDMTSHSLEIAESGAKKLGLKNLSFVQADIQTLDLGRKFDIVMNFGVLMVLADPMSGLRRLAAHVESNGRLLLWVYGMHGRYKLRLNQQMIALLAKRTNDWQSRMHIAKRVLASFPRKYLNCYFSVPTQSLEGDFEKSLDWIQTNEAWIADQFLHPNERSFDMKRILEMYDQVGMRLDQWIGVETEIGKYTNDPELCAWVRELSERDRLLFIDLLIKPVDYFVVSRHSLPL